MVAIHTSRGRRFSRGLGLICGFAVDPFRAPAKKTSPNPREVFFKKFRRVIVRFTFFPFPMDLLLQQNCTLRKTYSKLKTTQLYDRALENERSILFHSSPASLYLRLVAES